ncbi:MAG: hypothetical protein Q4D69_06810 [Buchananella hordeovulneris]|nr:hypothetical protein [Buchananella hordeovulneris]
MSATSHASGVDIELVVVRTADMCSPQSVVTVCVTKAPTALA